MLGLYRGVSPTLLGSIPYEGIKFWSYAKFKEVLPHNAAAVDRLVTVTADPYEAMRGAHAVALLTEWDEFTGACVFVLVSLGTKAEHCNHL